MGGLERSELGHEVTVEVKRWLTGEIGGPQCSQVVMDRALTVLANFKLASGCHLETLGGPLGAIVGGFSSADWLHEDVFAKSPCQAVEEGFQLLGLRSRREGDWSHIPAEEVSLAYRRLCLKGHPSRGGPPRSYLKLQVAMELIRALSEEAGPLRAPGSQTLVESSPLSRGGPADKDGFVLTDVALAKELKLTAQEAEAEAARLSQEELEEMNRALDEYILRLMCFKSEIVDEIARLHENCAYAILGVSADASDAEIKKAYRLIAMQCHPDKGGDKEDFQELHNAYEKIMEQRRVMSEAFGKHRYDFEEDPVEKTEPPAPAEAEEPPESPQEQEEEPADAAEAAKEPKTEDEAEESSNATLVEKAAKAAEEAARYAKTAQDFAMQAVEAAETARKGKEQGSRDQLTKSTAHSAIVLTLIVVKAVRVVGYATLDVAAQCRIAAKRNPLAEQCAERAVTAMGLGLEALNATLTCAEVTETTAAELQVSSDSPSEHDAERFVSAAVRASNAAQCASNAAVAAAMAAAEGSRDCIRALSAPERAAEPEPAADEPSEAEEAEAPSPPKPKPEPLTQEQIASNAHRRLVSQRNNNHKVLQRLNAEILSHQVNVRNILQTNRLLLPEVTGKSKAQVFDLLAGYVDEARQDLFTVLSDSQDPCQALVEGIQQLGMFIPFLQSQTLAISVCVKARVLKMAALYDFALAVRLIDEQVFAPILAALPASRTDTRRRLRELQNSIKEELQVNVSEDSLREGAATSSSD